MNVLVFCLNGLQSGLRIGRCGFVWRRSCRRPPQAAVSTNADQRLCRWSVKLRRGPFHHPKICRCVCSHCMVELLAMTCLQVNILWIDTTIDDSGRVLRPEDSLLRLCSELHSGNACKYHSFLPLHEAYLPRKGWYCEEALSCWPSSCRDIPQHTIHSGPVYSRHTSIGLTNILMWSKSKTGCSVECQRFR